MNKARGVATHRNMPTRDDTRQHATNDNTATCNNAASPPSANKARARPLVPNKRGGGSAKGNEGGGGGARGTPPPPLEAFGDDRQPGTKFMLVRQEGALTHAANRFG